MKLTYNYDRKDVFGMKQFTSDYTSFVGEREIDLAFKLFKKDPLSAIHLIIREDEISKEAETYSFTWEHYDDCKNGIVTMVHSLAWNIRDEGKQMTLANAKKLAKSFLFKEA